MDTEWIETFLTTAESGSISTAAQRLFLSQSTVSSRLAALEEELGYTLFDRARGKRVLELTEEGAYFLPLARSMADLKNQAMHREDMPLILRIAAVYSMNYSFLPILYQRIMKNCPEAGCRIITTACEEMYSLLGRRECDFCFSTLQLDRQEIRSRELFRQKIVVIMRDEHPRDIQTIHPRDLDPRREILHHSEPALTQWHNYWWEGDCQRLQVCSTYLLAKMMEAEEENACWALVPVATARAMPYPVQIYELTSPPPGRVCYLLEREAGLQERKRELFLEELDAFLRDSELMKKYDLEVTGAPG